MIYWSIGIVFHDIFWSIGIRLDEILEYIGIRLDDILEYRDQDRWYTVVQGLG